MSVTDDNWLPASASAAAVRVLTTRHGGDGGKKGKSGKGGKGDGKDKDVVWAFVFDDPTCTARDTYRLETINLNDLDDDENNSILYDRTTVTHVGECGVCSIAQDLAVILHPALNVKSFVCSNILAKGWDEIFDRNLPS